MKPELKSWEEPLVGVLSRKTDIFFWMVSEQKQQQTKEVGGGAQGLFGRTSSRRCARSELGRLFLVPFAIVVPLIGLSPGALCPPETRATSAIHGVAWVRNAGAFLALVNAHFYRT